MVSDPNSYFSIQSNSKVELDYFFSSLKPALTDMYRYPPISDSRSEMCAAFFRGGDCVPATPYLSFRPPASRLRSGVIHLNGSSRGCGIESKIELFVFVISASKRSTYVFYSPA